MDCSPEYILMCEKAVEVQELWKPESRDFLVKREKFLNYPQDTPFPNGTKMGEIGVWLPRQDQLQGMVKMPEWKLITEVQNFNGFVYNKPWNHCATWEQLWLALVMSELYSKVWSGTDWVKK
jgi:hypothetical protein